MSSETPKPESAGSALARIRWGRAGKAERAAVGKMLKEARAKRKKYKEALRVHNEEFAKYRALGTALRRKAKRGSK